MASACYSIKLKRLKLLSMSIVDRRKTVGAVVV